LKNVEKSWNHTFLMHAMLCSVLQFFERVKNSTRWLPLRVQCWLAVPVQAFGCCIPSAALLLHEFFPQRVHQRER
jgi:hypothetical protein